MKVSPNTDTNDTSPTAVPQRKTSEESLAIDWSSVPAGFEIFAGCRALTVRQEEDELEFVGNTGGFIRRNTYNIFDHRDHRLFHVLETTDKKMKTDPNQSSKRIYVISVFDSQGMEVLTIKRSPTCFGDGVECFLGDGMPLGYVKGNWRPFCMKNYYKVYGDLTRPHDPALLIEDAGWCSREFAVLGAGDKSTAHAYITKRLTAKEGIHDADVYVLEFKGSAELHPVYKALLLSTIFFLDFKYFEETREKQEEDEKEKEKKKSKKPTK